MYGARSQREARDGPRRRSGDHRGSGPRVCTRRASRRSDPAPLRVALASRDNRHRKSPRSRWRPHDCLARLSLATLRGVITITRSAPTARMPFRENSSYAVSRMRSRACRARPRARASARPRPGRAPNAGPSTKAPRRALPSSSGHRSVAAGRAPHPDDAAARHRHGWQKLRDERQALRLLDRCPPIVRARL